MLVFAAQLENVQIEKSPTGGVHCIHIRTSQTDACSKGVELCLASATDSGVNKPSGGAQTKSIISTRLYSTSSYALLRRAQPLQPLATIFLLANFEEEESTKSHNSRAQKPIFRLLDSDTVAQRGHKDNLFSAFCAPSMMPGRED